MGDRIQRKVFALLCAVLFLTASGVGPFGLHDCPHHDAAASHRSAPGATHHHGRSADGADEESSEGPCTCVGDCHASADTPVPLSGDHASARLTLGGPSASPLEGHRSVLGPRHRLFELHRPNAPPASL